MYLDLSYSLVRACADTMMFLGCNSLRMTSKTAQTQPQVDSWRLSLHGLWEALDTLFTSVCQSRIPAKQQYVGRMHRAREEYQAEAPQEAGIVLYQRITGNVSRR